jgi:peptidoglycan/xylan/chitin deacetylase (PgdA/CDA1 family)
MLGYGQTVHTTAVSNIEPEAKVSFSFDDGYTSTLSRAAPILAGYGFPGVSYVDTGNVGTHNRMQWDQLKQLQEQYGWELGAHSNSHPLMTKIPASQQQAEVSKSKQAFTAHGLSATSFATPYGDYSNTVLATIAKEYESHRGFHDVGHNPWPYSEYLLKVQQVQAGVTVQQVQQYIDSAIDKKRWLVLVFHDIQDNPSTDPEAYEYSPADLEAIAAYVKLKGVSVTTVSQGFIKSNVNLLPNATFDSGISEGWTTDTPDHMQADAANNGSYPSPKHSLKLTAGSTSNHLYSPRLPVSAAKTYMVKSFLNVETIVTGEIGYYIDEYNAHGKWISGQWKKAEKNAFVENINITYKPSSPAVASARLQVYVTPGAGITAYVDNFQWFPLK